VSAADHVNSATNTAMSTGKTRLAAPNRPTRGARTWNWAANSAYAAAAGTVLTPDVTVPPSARPATSEAVTHVATAASRSGGVEAPPVARFFVHPSTSETSPSGYMR
jgi:hypothetical protein